MCVARINASFLWPSNIRIYGYVILGLSLHRLIDIWFFSPFLTIRKTVAINIHVQVFVWMYVFNSLGYICRRGIGSYHNFIFNILRNCQIVF